MMDPVLGDYARNVPDARESEVLTLFATIINKYVSFYLFLLVDLLSFNTRDSTLYYSLVSNVHPQPK